MNTMQLVDISHGFSAGNFANAYNSEDARIAWRMTVQDYGECSEEFYHAWVLGFFSTYEVHEIPMEYQQDFSDAYYSPIGEQCLDAGYLDPI